MQDVFEQAVRADRFSGKNLLEPFKVALRQDRHLLELTNRMVPILGQDTADYVLLSLLRSTFLIELVKTPKIETTKFEVRWAARLPTDDPRYCSFSVCRDILVRAQEKLLIDLVDREKARALGLLPKYHMLPYELPIDYAERHKTRSIHTPDNLGWRWDSTVMHCVSLRRFFDTEAGPDIRATMAAAYDKIKVKTYLTDRVLTGEHKTNREKRWETHPGSVHFALRRQCMAVESALVEQICFFEGFPVDISSRLVQAGLIQHHDVSRCPVTMEPLSFDKFEQELQEPDHGKAAFQVGHLNPLKAVNDDPRSGHTSQNIAWISADGNRIQGSLSLSATQELLKKIAANYTRFGV